VLNVLSVSPVPVLAVWSVSAKSGFTIRGLVVFPIPLEAIWTVCDATLHGGVAELRREGQLLTCGTCLILVVLSAVGGRIDVIELLLTIIKLELACESFWIKAYVA